jgi:hypothetical protein
MKTYPHLMVNGFLKEPPKDLSIIKSWLFNLVEEINKEVKEIEIKIINDPTVYYVGNDSAKDIRSICIVDTGYIAIRIWEKEEDIFILDFDINISSSLPSMLVVRSIAENLGMYDGVSMTVDRGDNFEILGYKNYP